MNTSIVLTEQSKEIDRLLPSMTDAELLGYYLSQVDDFGEPAFTKATISNYQRDIRRLDFFISFRLGGKQYDDIDVEDVRLFKEWLLNPEPGHIGKAKLPADHNEWKPFYLKPLSRNSFNQQIVSVKAFFAWLNMMGCIRRNIFKLSKTASRTASKRPKRHLNQSDLNAVADQFDKSMAQAGITDKRRKQLNRQRWLFYGYLLGGFRISELPNLTTGNIYLDSVDGKNFWMIAVAGKGRREAEPHQLPDIFITELKRYRVSIGRPEWPSVSEPLIYNLNGTKPVASRSFAHNEFKSLIFDVAQRLHDQGDSDAGDRLLSASTHWLRHSFGTTLFNVTKDIPAASKLLRHKDIQTSMIYDHTEQFELSKILGLVAGSITMPEEA